MMATVALALALVGCDGDGDDALLFVDIGNGTDVDNELIEGISFYIDGSKPEPGDEVSAESFAVFRATMELYDNITIRSALVQQALNNEGVSTREIMGSYGFSDEFIDQLFEDLRGNIDGLPIDTFLKLPTVITYISQLQSAFAPLAS
jgi:hypothetical protein